MLCYDPITGAFTWNVNKGPAKMGSVAGWTRLGYCGVYIDGKNYQSHRLAWFYTYGEWPAKHLDHINGVRSDNRIANLREATASENQQNQNKSVSNKSGYPGVSWNRRSGKWQVHIMVNRKSIYLGSYVDIYDAVKARADGKRKHHTFQPYDRNDND